MKKIKNILLLILMMLPIMVGAKECAVGSIKIISIEQSGTIENGTSSSDPSFNNNNNNNKVSINPLLYVRGDSITYITLLLQEQELKTILG